VVAGAGAPGGRAPALGCEGGAAPPAGLGPFHDPPGTSWMFGSNPLFSLPARKHIRQVQNATWPLMQADDTRNGTPIAHSHEQRQQHHEIKEHARLLGKLIGFGMTSATGFLTPGSVFFPPYPPLPVEHNANVLGAQLSMPC
jgi:hypothetical protein